MAIRKVSKVLLALIAAYFSIVALVFFFQRSMMYFPSKEVEAPEQYGLNEFSEKFLPTSDNIKVQVWFKRAPEGNATIVYFHGNGDNIKNRVNRFSEFAAKGYGVLALSYRGYGKSEGKPTEEGLYSDARAALEFLKIMGVSPSRMIFYGESLGSGVAVQMATEITPKMIVLEAPFTSMGDVAQLHYRFLPVKYMVLDKFDSISKIENVKAPVLVLHGEKDTIVPHELGKKLADKAGKPKRFELFKEVGHVALSPEQIVQEIISLESRIEE